MKNKNFYSHIIEIDTLFIELDKLDLSEAEKAHLAGLIDSTLHHTVLDAILSELPENEKSKFLENLSEGDHKKIWEHLNAKVDGIELRIKLAADQLKVDLHNDLKEARSKKI